MLLVTGVAAGAALYWSGSRYAAIAFGAGTSGMVAQLARGGRCCLATGIVSHFGLAGASHVNAGPDMPR